MLLVKYIKVKCRLEFASKHYSFIKNYFIKCAKDREDLFLQDFSKLRKVNSFIAYNILNYLRVLVDYY
jgi:hypothetical protein